MIILWILIILGAVGVACLTINFIDSKFSDLSNHYDRGQRKMTEDVRLMIAEKLKYPPEVRLKFGEIRIKREKKKVKPIVLPSGQRVKAEVAATAAVHGAKPPKIPAINYEKSAWKPL